MGELLSKKILDQLSEPFPLDVISWKPQATTKDGNRALALTYADPRAYIHRLNDILGADWSDHYVTDILPDRLFITCYLTVCGVTRADAGEGMLMTSRWDKDAQKRAEVPDENAFTSAIAQAFKRACVKFGLGAYLYEMPQEWVDYDSDKRRFTEKGIQRLREVYNHHAGQFAPMDLNVAALATTSSGKALGNFTALQLKEIIDNAEEWHVRQEMLDAAEALYNFIAESVGPTDPEATYASIKGVNIQNVGD